MKILRVNLRAFGPFTDLEIDLSEGREGFHVIYGPNEAGKSSSLRALRQLLYGMPARSTDDFIHPYKKMRIGGILQHSDGTVIQVTRRKGNVNTLRDGDDDQPVDEARFQKFLGNIDEQVFATMFGIGHEDLVRGGEEIVQGGGEVGQALFAAGSGISDLRRVQAALQDEAEALFTPAASTRKINKTISAFREKQKALRDAQLPGQDWDRHDTALREALARRRDVDRELQSMEAELHRLGRIRNALPLIAKRRERLKERNAFTDAVLLPEDFGDRRARLMADLQVAESSRDLVREDLEETAQALARLLVDPAVIDRAERIEELYRELGSYQKAAGDRIKLQDRRDILRSEAREILSGLRKDLSLEDADTLRLERTRTARIQELGKQYERLMERLDSAREALPRLDTRIGGLAEELSALEPPLPMEGLDEALERAAGVVALEDHLLSERVEIAGARRSLKRSLERQTLWKGSLEMLDRLPLPSPGDMDVLERRMDEAEREVSELRSQLQEEEEALIKADGELKGLELEGEVPSERDLVAARVHRDDIWQRVRRALEAGERPAESPDPDMSLEEAYEAGLRRADELADRLRREADRVARKAKLVADRETGKERLDRLKAGLEEAGRAKDAAWSAWQGIWGPAGIHPRSPREMRNWFQEQRNLIERFQGILERERKAEAVESHFEACRQELDDRLRALSLPPAGENEKLSALAGRCRRIVRMQEALGSTREKLKSEKQEKELERKEAAARLHKAEQDLSRWQDEWEGAVKPLGLEAEALPAQAGVVMEDLAVLFDKLKEADILNKRIAGIDRDSEAYAGRVNELLARAAPDLKDRPVEQAVPELQARLNRAREDGSQKARLEKQQERQGARLRDAEARILELTSAVNVLCQEAGCPGYEDLAEAEARSNRLRKMESDLEGLEEQLRSLSGGAPVEAFVEEAGKVDPDEIEGRLLRLEEDMGGLREERTSLDRKIGEERNELSKMDGSSRAAGIAEEAQEILAVLERSVENYARLRLASTVLARAVERYRERHQGPVLKRTNELFARLTLGRFQGIRAEYDEQGTPVLVGVRPGGNEMVPVFGMSDGTADQLYLALRLASLEAYLEANEPMPFIVDDILIKFDDDRARAALEALAELSCKTQVIFFTHHRHLVELAEKSGTRHCITLP